MGDGTTPDNWYPYVFWVKDKDENTEPANATVHRSRYFQATNPWSENNLAKLGWLVHAGDLKAGDIVYFTPATLDFQWLDSAGRRFEIAYDKQGQRRDDQASGISRRPYLLDEIDTLNEIWETLKNHLSGTQIHILRDLIEAKRADWQSPPALEFDQNGKLKQIFWQFCHDALANADWRKGKEGDRKNKLPWEVEDKDGDKVQGKGRETWLARWANYAVRGWLADVVELHLHIMKEEVL